METSRTRIRTSAAIVAVLSVLVAGTGSAQPSTVNSPTTLGARVGAVTVDGSPSVYALGGDGKLWNNYWNGNGWYWAS